MIQSALLKHQSKYGTVIYNNGGVPHLEVGKLPGDLVDHQVMFDGTHCTCDPMPGEHTEYVLSDCPHRQALNNFKQEYLSISLENDDWLDFIHEQADRRTLWMM